MADTACRCNRRTPLDARQNTHHSGLLDQQIQDLRASAFVMARPVAVAPVLALVGACPPRALAISASRTSWSASFINGF